MQTKKMNLADIKGKLSREEMKNVLAGTQTIGGGCKTKFESECSISGSGDPEDICCSGLKCEMNASGTGTICV
jgi:hypothetical protein